MVEFPPHLFPVQCTQFLQSLEQCHVVKELIEKFRGFENGYGEEETN